MKRRMKRHAVLQPLDQSYRFIPLTQGQNAIVDAADFEWLNQWNWIADRCETVKGFYARRRPNIRMHRLILGCAPEEKCDHRNHNTLDNRRANLRKCTQSENMRNQRKRPDNKSGFRGVSWYPWANLNKWVANITCKGKRFSIGYFDTAEEAARAYDEKAKELHGEFAHLNFPFPLQ